MYRIFVAMPALPRLKPAPYINPKKAKRLHFDVIPKHVDEYLSFLKDYHILSTEENRYRSPIWHIHSRQSNLHEWEAEINFSLIHNLVGSLGIDDEHVILDYIDRYDNKASASPSILLPMVRGCIHYYQDHILPHKKFHIPSDEEKSLIQALETRLSDLPSDVDAERIQTEVFAVAKDSDLPAKDFFKLLYQTLLGQESGPRLGSFFKLLGLEEVRLRLHAISH